MTKELRSKITQLVGTASVCWDKYGVFQTEEAMKVVDDIFQAFADEGWARYVYDLDKTILDHNEKPLMTGQEWLSRFEKELEADQAEIPYGKSTLEVLDWFHGRVLEAAKRASGVDQIKPDNSDMWPEVNNG